MTDSASSTNNRVPWIRSESRQIRPFRYASDYLQDAALRLYEDAEFTTDEVLQEEFVDLQRLAPAIRVGRPPAILEEVVGASSDELGFIVIMEDPIIKRSSVIYQCRLDDIPSGLIYLEEQACAEVSWQGDIRLHVAVILTGDRDAQTGYARRAGSWLAKKSFRITKPMNAALFPIEAVDSAWFLQRNLPPTTTYLVQILDEDLNQPCSELPGLIKVMANIDLVRALSTNQESAAADAVLRSIYTDVVTTVLMTGFANLEGTPASNSILSTVVERLSNATGIPQERVITFARDKSGAELRAVVQAQADLMRAVISAVRRRA